MIQTRLIQQQLTHSSFTSPKELVAYMGALQAQNFSMAKWAIAARIPNIHVHDIESALNRGELLRTHVMRPTWHIVAADDIFWMLQLTAPRLIKVAHSYGKQLGMDASLFTTTNKWVRTLLETGEHYTRAEIALQLLEKGIELNNHQITHVMFSAELAGIACSGALRNKQQTYALLESRIPTPERFNKDEALGKLTLTYFTSHAPATLLDFVWWSGLSVSEAKRGLLICESHFTTIPYQEETYWIPRGIDVEARVAHQAHLLPAFDEYLVAYKNRNAVLSRKYYSQVITKNGIFKPVILEQGRVVGTWKTQVVRDKVNVLLEHFEPPSPDFLNRLEIQVKRYQQYSRK